MHDPAPDGVSPLRVLVVDADERVRASLTGLLSIGDRLVVVGAAGEARAALDLVASTQPDVVVVDPRLPELARGRAFVSRVRRAVPGVCVVALCLTDPTDAAYVDCQADGVVRKTFRPAELVEAIVAARARTAP